VTTATWTIVGYLGLVTLLGAWLSRRNRSSADWATGSGGMGIAMIAAGIAGTRIGGAGSYGVAGDVMNTGIWNVWYGVTTFLALALVGLFFAVPYRRLGLTTIGELFVRRFGRSRSAVLTSLCVQTEYLVVNVIEPLLIGVILSGVTGIPLWLGILIGAFVIITATASSGLKGTATTNIIHCAVIVGGLGLVGWVGMRDMGGWAAVSERANVALARYGADAGVAGYHSITRIALDSGPLIGGVALAAVLAALISSGGPILLASSTMFINDWVPGSADFSPRRKLRAYRITAVVYGLIAAGIACIFGYFVGTASVLEWLLLGFAMVVPPAIAIAYIFYVPSTTEPGVFWGIASGYGLGLGSWIVNKLFIHTEVDVPAYFTTIVQLFVIPLVSAFTRSAETDALAPAFYRRLRTPA
jgi:Na+/proline symporter